MLVMERKYDLREHLYQSRMTVTEFARKMQTTRTHISNIINGKIRPGKRLARDIEIETGGLITAEDLLKNFLNYPEKKE